MTPPPGPARASSAATPPAPAQATFAGGLIAVERHEWPALLASFAYFFFLLAGYYILRPIRDAMGVAIGTQQLPTLFTLTFVAMIALVPLFGWLTARLPRARLLPVLYGFFALNLAAFWWAMQSGLPAQRIGPVFFVWVSVYNLFVVSVFWSFMADLYTPAQAGRLYGAIAAGGSCGAIAGPSLTALFAERIGTPALLLVSAAFLLAALACVAALVRWSRRHPRPSEPHTERAVGGSMVAGLTGVLRSRYLMGICGYLLCYTLLSTVLYFQQVEIVGRELSGREERTRLFASIDLAVNSLTLVTQLLLFPALLRRIGTGWMLALIPLASVAGFLALGAMPVLAVLVVFGVLRRAGEFAISKPVRETLFAAVPREERYKAKNFIDTAVYRGGDTASGWLFSGMRALGMSLGAVSFAMVPVALGWTALAFWLGRRNAELRRAEEAAGEPRAAPGV